MGWTKEIKQNTDTIFNEVISRKKVWRGIPDDSSSAYEYFSDYLRDNFELTLWQCDDICKRLRDYYNIKDFYSIKN